ncbi:MAG: F0F1 ATP synthase subunit A [Austwickia sp.]|nr:MAG: F0F1 ATP synthase subunit A [Austwickia sp.]
MAILPAEGSSHFPPKPEDFWLPLWQVGGFWITRPMLICAFVTLGLAIWMITMAKKASVVPSKGQHYTELIYDFARNSVARDMIGSKKFRPYLPLIFALFVFILFNNLAGIIPPFQLPTMSRIGFPIGLVLVVYVVYHYVGIKHMGFGGYFKHMVPPGLPAWVVPVVFVLEVMTYFITRPLTLALRLFGNMFAGHMVLVVFIVGGWTLFTSDSIGLKFVALPAWLMAFVMTLFEALVQFLQAFVFTLLTASYIAGALEDSH